MGYSVKRMLRTAPVLVISAMIGVLMLAGCTSTPTATPSTEPTVAPAQQATSTPTVAPAQAQSTLEEVCTKCHSLERVFLKPVGTDWDAVLARMEAQHGATIAPDQKTAIVSLLKSRTATPAEMIITGSCTRCHDATRIYTAPEGTDWPTVLRRMSSAHGLVMTPEEQKQVTIYLQGSGY